MNTLTDENLNITGIITLNTPFFYVLNKDFTWILRWSISCLFFILAVLSGIASILLSDNNILEDIINIDINKETATSLILTILFMLIVLNSNKIANYMGNKSASNTNSILEKIVPNRKQEPQLLCLSTGDDEVFEGLQLLDNLANITTLTLGKWSSKIFLILIFIGLNYYFFLEDVFSDGIFIHLIISIIISPILLYAFYSTVVVISVFLSYLLRGMSQGNLKISWLHLYKRIIVTPAPIDYKNSNFKQIIPNKKTKHFFSHSALYEDDYALEFMSNWIIKTLKST